MDNQLFRTIYDFNRKSQQFPDRVHKLSPISIEKIESPKNVIDVHKASSPPDPIVEGSGSAIKVSRNLIGRTVSVSSTATQLVDVSYPRIILITNPSGPDSLSQTSTAYSGTVAADGNSQSSAVSVKNAVQVHSFINITAITGNWDFVLQTYDSVNATWADSQTLVSAAATTGSRYFFIGSNAVAEKVSFRWIQNVGATSLTFSIIVVMKFYEQFLPSGLSQTVYIGDKGVTTVSGYPILGGQEKQFILTQGSDLWGISNNPVDLRIFSL